MDRNQTLIDFERTMAFLENNQLVQACAVVQRLENSFRNEVASGGADADRHPFWPALKATMRVKTMILSGNRQGAEAEWSVALGSARTAFGGQN